MTDHRPSTPESEDWFAEAPVGGYEQRYRVLQRLHRGRTDLQDLEVFELEAGGRALVLDGALQTTVGEEFTYHEPLVHVPMFAHPKPRRVLIVGGGDGGALRHALLHPTVERAVQAEIDGGVVDASRQYLPEISGGAFDDPRTDLRITDGVAFIAGTDERFDVIIVDSTDPVGPAAALIGDEFIASARGVLAPGGIMVMQSSSPLTQPLEFTATVGAFRRGFREVKPYLGFVPIYPGIQWSWVAGSETLDPASIDVTTVGARVEQLPERLRIYNPALHRAMFALPNYLQRLLELDRPPTRADLHSAGHPLPGVVPA